MSDVLDDILGDHEYDTNNWAPIKAEAAVDMRYVSGNPWDADDKKIRENRPTVAPEEMSQYRNQVANALMANPRGGKFSPRGNGANDKGAEFYQNKWREIEYRSHGAQQYITTVDNALQRSYGFMRVATRWASPRSANQDIWLDAFPDPDMVLPDTDAKQLDGSDAVRAVVEEWITEREFKRLYKGAKVVSFEGRSEAQKKWAAGNKVRRAECWRIQTRLRTLVLVQPPLPPAPPAMVAPRSAPPPRPLQVFVDELEALKAKMPGLQVLRELRAVDFPTVKSYMTNGVEILSESAWAGQYIPIVPCYGKVLYVPEGGDTKKVILSMTRFGRDPWKSYCYACSQELEVLAMVPKSPLLAVEGQFEGREQEVQDSFQTPKAFLYYKAKTAATGELELGAPQPLAFPGGAHLQALEIVKEGFRRAIQAAMGSNFLPTNAQRINDKSGKALDKIDEVASQGTYHFVYAYEGMIRRCAVIGEDLLDKIYDYAGETPVRTADEKTQMVVINDPANKESVATAGDYGVTVSTAPSTDSEREAAEEFLNQFLGQIQMIAQIAGPKVAAAMLAISIRMRGPQLGAMSDQLADLVEPAEFKQNDGKPPDPRLLAAQAQIQQLTQQLQQLGFVIQTKQIEGQAKLQIARENNAATSFDKAADREVKLAIAELAAKFERMQLFLDERGRVGVQVHDAQEARLERTHDAVEAHKDRQHQGALALQNIRHQAASSAGDAAVGAVDAERQHAHEDQQRAAGMRDQLAIQAAAPPPAGGNGASA